MADIFTKPVDHLTFIRHRPTILGNKPTGLLLDFLTSCDNFKEEYKNNIDEVDVP